MKLKTPGNVALHTGAPLVKPRIESCWCPDWDCFLRALRLKLGSQAQATAAGKVWKHERALALSLFVHAHLIRSPGDNPDNLKLRSWLQQVGVTLSDDGTGEQNQKTVGSWTWLDLVSTRLSETEEPVMPDMLSAHAAESGSALHADLDSVATSPARIEHDSVQIAARDVCKYHWSLVRGVIDYAITPAGPLALIKAARPEAGQEATIRLDLARRLQVPSLKSMTIGYFYGAALLGVASIVGSAIENIHHEYSQFSNFSPLWVQGWTDNYLTTIANLFYALCISIFFVRKLRSDFANRCFPIPARCTGKLEYACLWVIIVSGEMCLLLPSTKPTRAAWQSLLSSDDGLDASNVTKDIGLHRQVLFHSPDQASDQERHDGVEDLPLFSKDSVLFESDDGLLALPQAYAIKQQLNSPVYMEFSVNVLYLTIFTLVGTYEAVVASAHAFAATWRFGDGRYLFEMSERWAVRKHVFD